jgi:2-polyprenyl-6-methoxyphenol hydroxylase-like FAD-dependent oxidoreductase
VIVRFDVAIVGAGPVGLGFATALGETGLRVALIETPGCRTG